MSEDHAGFPVPPVPHVIVAREVLRRRGQDLPVAALRVLAREVILRVSRVAIANTDAKDHPSRSDIDLLCDALLSNDDTAASDLVRAARLGGMRAHALYHHYIAAAVRQFGDRWDRDQASSAQVIMGAGRVYAILRELRTVFLAETLAAPPGAEAVFASIPGEVHGLGITIAADAMRLKGWDITLRLGLDHERLIEEIAALRPTMIGLSASVETRILPAARLIVALRMRCPHVWIILGGGLVEQDPDIARIVDADAVALSVEDGAEKLASHLHDLNRMLSARA